MKKATTFINRLLMLGAVAGSMASCTSSKIGLLNTTPAGQSITAVAPAAEEEAAPAAAQGAQTADVYASAEAMAPVTTVNTLEQARKESLTQNQAPQAQAKKQSLANRMVTKALVKKLEKASSKFDGKNEKARKAAKVSDPQIRTGIIIALVGLGLTLVGALTGLWFLYTLGGIGITVGLVIILLAALDVI
jgi:hypothetical protein